MKPPTAVPHSTIDFYLDWFERDGHPFWPFWENIRSWWEIRHHPNVHLVHFANLKTDLAGEIRKIAEFIETPINESNWQKILYHCGFEYMKKNADKFAPMGGKIWKNGGQTFIHKGTNGQWRDILSAEDITRYEQRAIDELGIDCAHWLATGELP